jgi:hypothetical protein
VTRLDSDAGEWNRARVVDATTAAGWALTRFFGLIVFWGFAELLSRCIGWAWLKYARRGGRQYAPGRVYQSLFRER